MIPEASSSGQTSRVVYESTDTVRKWGADFRLRRETEAMAFVRKHTSIPIPAVIDVQFPTHEADGPSWILMKRLPGSQMGDSWHAMSKHARAEALRQLKSYFDQLHRLRPSEPGWIGSCSKGPAYDHRLNNMSICGPFASVSAFNDFLVAPVKNCPRPEWVAKYRSRLRDSHGITFAHSDISWENILVDPPTGNITGILDWEMAGYWPEWWEYRKALFGSRSQSWWRDILKEVMQEYPEETETDMELEMF